MGCSSSTAADNKKKIPTLNALMAKDAAAKEAKEKDAAAKRATAAQEVKAAQQAVAAKEEVYAAQKVVAAQQAADAKKDTASKEVTFAQEATAGKETATAKMDAAAREAVTSKNQPLNVNAETPAEGKFTIGNWNILDLDRGNPARYLLWFGRVDYEDKRHTIEEEEWKNAKCSNDMDFPNLPYFMAGEFKITETNAIQQFIAENFCPAVLGTPEQRAMRQNLQRIANEEFDKACNSITTYQTEADKTVIAKAFISGLDVFLEHMGDQDFLGGDDPCIADFILMEHLMFTAQTEAQYEAEELRYSKLYEIMGRIGGLPAMMENAQIEGRHIAWPGLSEDQRAWPVAKAI